MERIAVIDRTLHTLYVEDVNEDILIDNYNGNVDEYIKDNYYTKDYSWGYINDAQYIPATAPYDDPIEIDFDELIDKFNEV